MKYDVVVVGAGPAGLVTASTVKKVYPEKSVLIVKKEEVGMIPCGIPYIFGTLGSVEANTMPIQGPQKLGVEFLVDEVVDGNLKEKKLYTKSGKEIEYEKLVLATGSIPVIPPIEGKDLKGVYYISKYSDYLKELFEALKEVKKVVIIGGGFIGVEVADELRKAGKEVTIIEMLDHLLPAAFDSDFGDMAKEELEKFGVKVLTSTKVEKILGENKVEGVLLSNGDKLEADMVIFATGYKPNVELAEKLGLTIVPKSGIWVDEYMRTSDKDVFAVGDCAVHRCYFTRQPSPLMLASVASFEARLVGANIFGIRIIRQNKGNLGVFSTYFGNLSMAAAGLREERAKADGFEIVIGEASGVDRHPGKFEDTSKIKVKLIFSKDSGILLGGEVAGGKSVGEIINAISIAIQKELTITEIMTLQIGTHPLLTSAPTVYPLVIAAESAYRKIR